MWSAGRTSGRERGPGLTHCGLIVLSQVLYKHCAVDLRVATLMSLNYSVFEPVCARWVGDASEGIRIYWL